MKFETLNERITLQKEIKVLDSLGGAVTSWVDIATIWAGIIEELSNDTSKEKDQVQSFIKAKITIRFRTGISTLQRVKYGNRYFSILSAINKDGKNEQLVLKCKEAPSC
jgi:SPP1 family predicted phage head-tail adaptor